jgi:hypothetical protein
MGKRGETQHFQLRIDGPPTSWSRNGEDEKIRSSYGGLDTAVGHAREASRSRELRGPASHVLVVDKRDEVIQYEWHGPETPEGIANGGEAVERNPAWR